MAQKQTNGLNPVKKVPIHLQSSQNRLIIKGGRIVNSDGVTDGDVFIEDGAVKEIGKNLIIPGGTRSIDARGKLVLPGGIDPSTHFHLEVGGVKSVDDFYTGTKAAVAGGTTLIIDTVMPKRGESLLDALGTWKGRAENQVCCDYSLHMGVTWWSDSVKSEMETLVREHGINSFKLYMCYKDTAMLKDNELLEAFTHCRKLGAIAIIHAENGDVILENEKKLLAADMNGPEAHELSRPEDVETEATLRASVLASQVNCPLYVSPVMSKGSSEVIAKKREDGSVIFGETIAAAIAADGTSYWDASWRHAAAHVMNPPLRPDTTLPDQMVNYLARDDLQVVGSEHCTFTHEQKKLGIKDFRKIPPGVNGVEDRLSVLWQRGVQEGRMDPARFVAISSTNAAKIFNLFPNKGAIAVGSDADIVVWNPRASRKISSKTHHHATDNNIFEGMECFGVPEFVICNGRVCVDEGQVKVLQGYGHYIDRSPRPEYVYDMVSAAEKKFLDKIKPVSRDSFDGQICNRMARDPKGVKAATNAVEELRLNSPQSQVHISEPASLQVSSPLDEMAGIKTTNVRNMQESTLDKDSKSAPEFREIMDAPVGPNNNCINSPEDTRQRSTIRVKAPPGGHSSVGEPKTTVRIRQPPGGRSSGLW